MFKLHFCYRYLFLERRDPTPEPLEINYNLEKTQKITESGLRCIGSFFDLQQHFLRKIRCKKLFRYPVPGTGTVAVHVEYQDIRT